MKAKAPHTVLGNNSMRCLHCGVEEMLDMPLSIRVFTALGTDFAEQHAHCKPSDAGLSRFVYTTPEQWANSWDTGESSKTIWRFMHRGFVGHEPSPPPQDSSDFGRCYRLLRAFPTWRARMHEMWRVTGWDRYVKAWHKLEREYEEELRCGESLLNEELERLRS